MAHRKLSALQKIHEQQSLENVVQLAQILEDSFRASSVVKETQEARGVAELVPSWEHMVTRGMICVQRDHNTNETRRRLSRQETPPGLPSTREDLVSRKVTREELEEAERRFVDRYRHEFVSDEVKFLKDTPRHLYLSFPPTKLQPMRGGVIAELEGPDDLESAESFLQHICARTRSSYPHLPSNPVREGDPVCDAFRVRVYDDARRVIVGLADGCNWGARPRQAARDASRAFVEYVERAHRGLECASEVGHLLLRAVSVANLAISEGRESYETGTTTFLGGLLLELDNETDEECEGDEGAENPDGDEEPEYLFTCVNVGDCKAFHWRPSTHVVQEVTHSTRSDAKDASDPGGRLGPYLENARADLRNLSLFSKRCELGDYILMMSDGVYDNFDPHHQGFAPRDLGLNGETWDEVAGTVASNVIASYRLQCMANLFGSLENITPQKLANMLVQHGVDNTMSSRKFMMEKRKRLPTDYVRFPGKMDHTTCIAIRVGEIDEVQRRVAANEAHLPVDRRLANFDSSIVSTHVPLTVSIIEGEDHIKLICHTLPNCSLSCSVLQNIAYLRAECESLNQFAQCRGNVSVFGQDELSQPIIRCVVLPHKVRPVIHEMLHDKSSGLVSILLLKNKHELKTKTIRV